MISGQPDGGLIIDDFEKFMNTDEIDKGKYKERYYTGRLRVGDELKKGRQLIHERKTWVPKELLMRMIMS